MITEDYRGWTLSVYRIRRNGTYTGDATDRNRVHPRMKAGLYGGVGAKAKAMAALKRLINWVESGQSRK